MQDYFLFEKLNLSILEMLSNGIQTFHMIIRKKEFEKKKMPKI